MVNPNRRSTAPVRKLLAAVVGAIAAFIMLFGLGMGSWAIVALGAALLLLAIGLAMVNVNKHGARAWVAGTAHVRSISEPPAGVSYGRAELAIVVGALGLPAAAVTVRDPRVPVSKWPDPGATLPVLVAIDDMRRVRIQWDDVMTHAEAAAAEDAESYPDPAQTFVADEYLAETEVHPWKTQRGRPRWAAAADQETPGAVAVREDTSGGTGAPIILEGTLVEPQPAPAASPDQPVQQRRKPSPRPRPGDDSPATGPAASGGDSGGSGPIVMGAGPISATTSDESSPSGAPSPSGEPSPSGPSADDPDRPAEPADGHSAGGSHVASGSHVAGGSQTGSSTKPGDQGPGSDPEVDLDLDGPPTTTDRRPAEAPEAPAPSGSAGPGPVAAGGVADGSETPRAPTETGGPAPEGGPRLAAGAIPTQSRPGMAEPGRPTTSAATARIPSPRPVIPGIDEPRPPVGNGINGTNLSDPASRRPAPDVVTAHPDEPANPDKPAGEGRPGSADTGDDDPEAGQASGPGPARAGQADAATTTGEAAETASPGQVAGALPAGDEPGATADAANPDAVDPDAANPDAAAEDEDHEGHDSRLDGLITAYPTARPGRTGAIHGVGMTVLVSDLDRSRQFYQDMLGFHEIDRGRGNAVLASGDTRLVLRAVTDVSGAQARPVHLNLEVGDVRAMHAELIGKGARFTHGPRIVNRGEKLELWAASLDDPDGHSVAISQWRAVR